MTLQPKEPPRIAPKPRSVVSTGRRYMSKAQRACDFCRSRKSACQIDTAPPCRQCKAHAQLCEFTDRIVRKKRPIPQAKPSTSPTHTHDGRDEQRRPQESPSREVQQCLSFVPLTGSSFSLGSPGFDAHMLDFDLDRGLEEALRSSVDDGQAVMDELMLSLHDSSVANHASLESHQPLVGELCGLTGDMDPYLLRHYQFDEKSRFAFSKLTICSMQDTEVPVQLLLSKTDINADVKAQTRLTSPGDDSIDLSDLVPPEIGQRLIQLFFRFINPLFPILRRSDVPNPSTASTHLLAAIYLITQPFTTFDDYLCIELVYNRPSPHSLFGIAWRALNNALSEPNFASLQAGLILLLQPPANPLLLDSAFKWTLLGMIVSMAQTLGIHLDPSLWNLPDHEIRMRRVLSWMVYAVDKWLAASLGRPSHISRDEWLITELDPADISFDIKNDSYACQFSNLTVILDKVLGNLYSLRSVSTLSKDYQRTMSVARPIMQDLTTWQANLPPSLVIEHRATTEPPTSDASASLHIAYQSVKILVLRALLRPFRIPGHGEQTPEWQAAKAHVLKAASAETEAALSVVSSFSPVHYQAFWAPWSKTGFALITNLLFSLAIMVHQERKSQDGSSNEYMKAREALDRARIIFRLHAKSLDMIQFALLRIDAVFWIGWEKVLGFQ